MRVLIEALSQDLCPNFLNQDSIMKKLHYYLSAFLMLCSICVLVFAKDITSKDTNKQEKLDIESLPLHFESLALLFQHITDISWQIHTLQGSYDFKQKEELIAQKNLLLQNFIANIRNTKQSLGFDMDENKQMQMRIDMQLNDAKIQHDNALILQEEIAKNNLIIESHLATLFKNLRKQIDFFSQKQKVVDIIQPTLQALNAMPTTFDISAEIPTKQQKNLKLQIEKYRNTLASAIEIVSYLEWHADEFVPQNTILHACMRWTLQLLSNFMSVNHGNLVFIKIVLSLLCFVILWAYRKLITRVVVYLMDLAIQLTNQDKDLHSAIQKNLLQPISLFLLAWSLRVCIGVLYYPHLQPEEIEAWFNILYIVNVAWFMVALVKSYGTVLLTKILQKRNNEFRREIINLILKALYAIIIIIACLLILKYLGFNVSAIIASLGLGGLAVALAVKDILANFFASVMLLFDNSFSQGDWIECNGVDGVVVEIGLRRTTVRTADNALLFVPNAELAGKIIRNWSRRRAGRRIKMSVGVTYDADEARLKKCVASIRQMLLDHPEVVTTPIYNQEETQLMTLRKDIISLDDFLGYKSGLFVCVEALADSSINILVECFTQSVSKKDYFEVREDVIFKIMAIVQECNLSFAFPSQSVYVETLPK